MPSALDVADHQEGPAVTDHLEGACYRTDLPFVVALQHNARISEVTCLTQVSRGMIACIMQLTGDSKALSSRRSPMKTAQSAALVARPSSGSDQRSPLRTGIPRGRRTRWERNPNRIPITPAPGLRQRRSRTPRSP